MVSKNPKTPKRDFVIKYKGKKANIVVSTEGSNPGNSWGGQILCLWGCSAKFVVTGWSTPKKVAQALQMNIENHWKIKHKD